MHSGQCQRMILRLFLLLRSVLWVVAIASMSHRKGAVCKWTITWNLKFTIQYYTTLYRHRDNYCYPSITATHVIPRLGVKYFQKYLNANTSKYFKCKYFYFLQMQMQILFKNISNTFSNTFKYFDRYVISIKNRNNTR